MKSFNVEKAVELTEEERETIESLVNYPSLERAFEQENAQTTGAEKIKQKMEGSVAEFERVLRRGARAEAERAERILTAYKTTLAFLDELEQMRKNQAA
jgi:hypothetical protein